MSDTSIQLGGSTAILFIGNSFTFGRVDPVMSYNTDKVRDMTAPVPGTSFSNTTGSNTFEPHPWGGVPGVFKEFTDQAGIDYAVSLSTRNAASLQGHYLNSNPAGWDLRGNLASQRWDTVVLQDNSTETLPSGAGRITFAAGSNTATLTLTPRADAKLENNETIGLRLLAGEGYRLGSTGTVTGTILNDDPNGAPVPNPALPTVTLVASPSAVLENGSERLVYTFTRTGPTDQPLRIDFGAARDGSTAPSVNLSNGDFENFVANFTTSFNSNGVQTTGRLSFNDASGFVDIPAGASSATLILDPRPDTAVENDESVYLSLSVSAAYNVGTPGAVSATILNDDFPPGTDLTLPAISLGLVSASTVYEDGTGALVWRFTRTGPLDQALSVDFAVTGSATLPNGAPPGSPAADFTVAGADSFRTAGAANPDRAGFETYATKLAQYATSGAQDGAIPANPNANAATEVFLYETWARPNLVLGARVATTDEVTGASTTSDVSAGEYYATLEDMTADLRAAYRGLGEANPIFRDVAPVGEAFLRAVQQGTAIRDPYTETGTEGRVNLWWDDNLHASKYGSYLSALTLFGTITGLDPRALGAGERAAADLSITRAEAGALQAVAAATLGLSLQASWTAPGVVVELGGDNTGLLATAGSFGFSDNDLADTHAVSVSALTPGALGTLSAVLWSDTTGDGTGGAVNWLYTVDNAAVEYLVTGESRVEMFLVTVSDANGGTATREIAVTINGAADWVDYSASPAAVVVDLAARVGRGGAAEGAALAGIENVVGSRFGDVLTGSGARNVLFGGDGDDLLLGGGGNDRLEGGAGVDTVLFSGRFADHAISDFGTHVRVSGPDGDDTVVGAEIMGFADGTVRYDDGDRLFDTLFYLSRNPDVFAAGVDARVHYQQFGFAEGRNPNAVFDTGGYLSANPDVRAADLNPLEHYAVYGAAEGRDPSAGFDAQNYLARNPDVAAAKLNPLEHFLAYGAAEGRAAVNAVGTAAADGFDAGFYLLANPDVGRAGIDGRTHYELFGRAERRDPNGYFDADGYLARNADVAAAGVDALTHYNAYGWREGRDPSAGFDTALYLAANADVAAAGVNPLLHFLLFGATEGRVPATDGVLD